MCDQSRWVIDYSDPRLFDQPTPGLDHMVDADGAVWCQAAEGFAALGSKSLGVMKPRGLSTAIRCLKAFLHHYDDVQGPTERYRLRNVNTGEIIPLEALGI